MIDQIVSLGNGYWWEPMLKIFDNAPAALKRRINDLKVHFTDYDLFFGLRKVTRLRLLFQELAAKWLFVSSQHSK